MWTQPAANQMAVHVEGQHSPCALLAPGVIKPALLLPQCISRAPHAKSMRSVDGRRKCARGVSDEGWKIRPFHTQFVKRISFVGQLWSDSLPGLVRAWRGGRFTNLVQEHNVVKSCYKHPHSFFPSSRTVLFYFLKPSCNVILKKILD